MLQFQKYYGEAVNQEFREGIAANVPRLRLKWAHPTEDVIAEDIIGTVSVPLNIFEDFEDMQKKVGSEHITFFDQQGIHRALTPETNFIDFIYYCSKVRNILVVIHDTWRYQNLSASLPDSIPSASKEDFEAEDSIPSASKEDFEAEDSIPSAAKEDVEAEDSIPSASKEDFEAEGMESESPEVTALIEELKLEEVEEKCPSLENPEKEFFLSDEERRRIQLRATIAHFGCAKAQARNIAGLLNGRSFRNRALTSEDEPSEDEPSEDESSEDEPPEDEPPLWFLNHMEKMQKNIIDAITRQVEGIVNDRVTAIVNNGLIKGQNRQGNGIEDDLEAAGFEIISKPRYETPSTRASSPSLSTDFDHDNVADAINDAMDEKCDDIASSSNGNDSEDSCADPPTPFHHDSLPEPYCFNPLLLAHYRS